MSEGFKTRAGRIVKTKEDTSMAEEFQSSTSDSEYESYIDDFGFKDPHMDTAYALCGLYAKVCISIPI